MPKQSKIKLTKFTYPNGSVAWRVSGSIHGKQVRKNFSERAAALEEKQRLEIQQTNGSTDGRMMWVKITQQQHDEAWAAFQRLAQVGAKKPLPDIVEFYLNNPRESAEQVSLETAVGEYLAEKSRDETRKLISSRQYRSIRVELDHLKAKLGNPLVGEILPGDLINYLKENPISLKTWNNRRGYLSTFFKFCLAQKYAGHDPVLEVPQYKIKHRRSSAETLSADQVEKLMAFLETYEGSTAKIGKAWGRPGCLVPYFALTLFAGIRPDWKDGEIGKLKPEHINLDTGVIHIEPEVSKVNEKRSILIQPNLRLWLEKYPVTEFPIVPKSCFKFMRLDIRNRFKLGHDILRHTYISMLVGAFRSVGDAALQAGNSEAIVRKHYLDMKGTEEADKFWQIRPAGTKLPEKFKKEDGRYVYREPTVKKKRASKKAAGV